MISGIPPRDTQSYYDRVRAYFDQPGATLAREKNGTKAGDYQCMYRTEDGRGCAVGCTLPNRLYKPEMENSSIEYILGGRLLYQGRHEETIDTSDIVAFYKNVDTAFMQAAQSAHDDTSTRDVRHFLEKLDLTAAEYGLTVPS